MRTHRHLTRRFPRHFHPTPTPAARSPSQDPNAFARLRNLLLENLLLEKPSWRIRDTQGRWFCPFCAKKTDVELQGASEKETVARLETHLRACETFWSSGGVERSQAFLEIQAQVSRRLETIRGPALKSLSTDPLWQCRDLEHRWICPFCRRVVTRIRWLPGASADGLVDEVAGHLAAECIAYQQGVEHSRQIGGPETLPPPSPPKGGRLVPKYDAWIEDLRTTVEAQAASTQTETHFEQSLKKARQVQNRMLPKLPTLPGVSFGVLYVPCAQVSGDFYDFMPRGGREIGILVGDASGHGMEAALVMAMAKKALQVAGRTEEAAGEALRVANAELFPDLGLSAFLTAFFGILNLDRMSLRFARAGHNPLILFNPARTKPLHVLKTGGMAIGMDRGPLFDKTLEEFDLRLKPGDLLLQYTDGIPESRDPKGEEFGMERFLDVVRRHGTETPERIVKAIEQTVTRFRAGVSVEDDLTALAIRIGG